MNDAQRATHVEALLFALGRPLSRSELMRMMEVSATELESALTTLAAQKKMTGVMLVDDGSVIELRTAPDATELIEHVRKEEYSRELGKAGLETLAAVLYRGPLTRSEIDFIRGVNSSQILRTLTMRGLLRKISNPKDVRSFLYEPTTELLAELGTTNAHDLPDYAQIREKLKLLETTYRGSTETESV